MIKLQSKKQRAPRNRTITLNDTEIERFRKKLIKITKPALVKDVENKTICQDVFEVLDYLPNQFIDLV